MFAFCEVYFKRRKLYVLNQLLQIRKQSWFTLHFQILEAQTRTDVSQDVLKVWLSQRKTKMAPIVSKQESECKSE
jgi:hypothetical protein